jgi:hypothetical protein
MNLDTVVLGHLIIGFLANLVAADESTEDPNIGIWSVDILHLN